MATIKYNEAVKAALARVEGDNIPITTLTVSAASLDEDLRVFRDGKPDGYIPHNGSEVGYLNCIIEDGSTQMFLEMPFDIKLPDENDGGSRRAGLTLSNINRDIGLAAQKACEAGNRVFVTFRGYLYGMQDKEMGSEPLTFEVKKVSLSGIHANIEMIISMPNMTGFKYPFDKYNVEDHPALSNQTQRYTGQ